MMVYLFLGALLLGLVLGVIAMLVGLERRPGKAPAPGSSTGLPFSRESVMAASSEISARFHLAIVAPFATAFGATGYLLERYTSLSGLSEVIIGVVAGGGAATTVVILVARWAVPSARRDVPDVRYLWQGLPPG
jgi:hypothetical protein